MCCLHSSPPPEAFPSLFLSLTSPASCPAPNNGLYPSLSSGTPCMTQSPSGFGSSVGCPTLCLLVSFQSFRSAFDLCLLGLSSHATTASPSRCPRHCCLWSGRHHLSHPCLKIWSLFYSSSSFLPTSSGPFFRDLSYMGSSFLCFT